MPTAGAARRRTRAVHRGTQPVYAVDDGHAPTLFPAAAVGDGMREARVLEFLHGRLPVATPELYAAGECENA
ncbi:hypothetical protein [Streptomyces sp. cg35]|uniref:hypothetical protein n=1 Tax=Streptomyces sp. cg35 TaxID=3421650 RepID=UPI003D1745A8